jgi:hypothetical protein
MQRGKNGNRNPSAGDRKERGDDPPIVKIQRIVLVKGRVKFFNVASKARSRLDNQQWPNIFASTLSYRARVKSKLVKT